MPAAPSSTGFCGAQLAAHVGVDEARAGRVDQHAGVRELGGEDAGHRVQRGLGHPVAGRPAAHLGHAAHAARDVDHARMRRSPAAAAAGRRSGGRRRRSWCRARPGSRRSPGRRRPRRSRSRSPALLTSTSSRPGSEPTRAAAAAMLSGSETSSVSGVTFAPVASDSSRPRVRLLLVARRQDDVVAALGELAGDLAADAAVGARDERDLAVRVHSETPAQARRLQILAGPPGSTAGSRRPCRLCPSSDSPRGAGTRRAGPGGRSSPGASLRWWRRSSHRPSARTRRSRSRHPDRPAHVTHPPVSLERPQQRTAHGLAQRQVAASGRLAGDRGRRIAGNGRAGGEAGDGDERPDQRRSDERADAQGGPVHGRRRYS